jgi:uncharacterized protein YdaU (DUF1376 family)
VAKRLKYYRRYMRDFEDGCHGLSWEQRGFYSAIVDEIYLTGGPVEIDWRVFSKRASSNAALAKRLLFELVTLGKLYVMDDGKVGNPRADKEIQNIKKALIENIEKSKVLPNVLAKHAAKEFRKTQQKLRARDRRAQSSTNIDKPSMLVPSFQARGNGSAMSGSIGLRGFSPDTPADENLSEEEIAAVKQRLSWSH